MTTPILEINDRFSRLGESEVEAFPPAVMDSLGLINSDHRHGGYAASGFLFFLRFSDNYNPSVTQATGVQTNKHYFPDMSV